MLPSGNWKGTAMRLISTLLLARTLLALSLLYTSGAIAHEDDPHTQPGAEPPLILGVLDFPTSGDPAAQEAFERGVMLLHSFEYDDARRAFLEAQAIDSGFAMAIWGEAMTLNHPLWNRQMRDEALEVLAKLPAADLRRTTPLEERFIETHEITWNGIGSGVHSADVPILGTSSVFQPRPACRPFVILSALPCAGLHEGVRFRPP